jgi:hypothetical protein
MVYKISTMADANYFVAKLFELAGNQPSKLAVYEERCFLGCCLEIGSIVLVPESERVAREPSAAFVDAVQGGAFEWKVRSFEEVQRDLVGLLEIREPAPNSSREIASRHERSLDRISQSLNCVAHAAVRLGLIHPSFDAGSLEELPFRRATTIVADTTGILQGALDFVARFLHPTARMKIPAIAHMEIVEQADRFLSMRRSRTAARSPAALHSHLISQGGQRALLRLELQLDTEIERSAIFGDPLRNAFNRDEEFRDLNLNVPLRSYCDRLVLETARQHQSYSSPGHPVLILTSDQGLARMALAEGIKPLHFRAVHAEDLFGEIVSGVNFDPFTGEIYRVSLTALLWELATIFGGARISDANDKRALEIAAIGQNIVWAPFHSQGDLLGIRLVESAPTARPTPQIDVPLRDQEVEPRASSGSQGPTLRPRSTKQGFYRFSVASLFLIIDQMEKNTRLTARQISTILRVQNAEQISEYRKFLESGEFICLEDSTWVATEQLHHLMVALRTKDFTSFEGSLQRTPSFRTFLETLTVHGFFSRDTNLPFSKRALPTYEALAEIVCAGAPIFNEGFFATPNNPTPIEFAAIGLRRYDELAEGQPLVPVGAWLEHLVRRDGIHPLRARDRLDEATAMGALRLITEGSTLDTHYDRHAFRMVEVEQGRPVIRVIHLYRGDFLIPGKASASLRLEGTPT